MDAILVILLLIGALALFTWERHPPDLTALGILLALALTGVLTPREAISGFSHPATVTVAAMFALSAGLRRTGALSAPAALLTRAARHPLPMLALTMILVGAVSAFINNTAAVAVFLPITLSAARARGLPTSRLLIPLSFASQFGGVCTVIGTSTNLLVSGIAAQHGYGEFDLFEMGRLGLPLFAAGAAYFLIAGRWLLPRHRGGQAVETYRLRDYLFEMRARENSPLIGKTVSELRLGDQYDVTVVEIIRNDRKIWFPVYEPIRAGDILLVRGKIDRLMSLKSKARLELPAEFKLSASTLGDVAERLIEALVAPGSSLAGRTLREAGFGRAWPMAVLGLQREGQLLSEKLADVALEPGDALLLLGSRETARELRARGDLVLLGEVDPPRPRPRHAWRATGIVAAVVALAATKTLPIVIGAPLGVALLVLSGCLRMEEAYEAIDWRVIFLLGGLLPLGLAMEKTGAAALIAHAALHQAAQWGPIALLAIIYAMTAVLTQCMSNNACAAVMAPIAISAANQFGLDPKPLLMGVAFAASTSFATPVGYQTNLMVYHAGGYRFGDFLRAGIPLTFLFGTIAVWQIPQIWPF